MSDQPAPRRRFQFRLRTLMIVVTLFCLIGGYVTSQANIATERTRLAKNVLAYVDLPEDTVIGRSEVTFETFVELPAPISRPSVNWLRRLFGDKDVGFAAVPASISAEDLMLVESAFPEATIAQQKVTTIRPYPQGESLLEEAEFGEEFPGMVGVVA